MSSAVDGSGQRGCRYRLGRLFHAREARSPTVERYVNNIVLRDTESPEELFFWSAGMAARGTGGRVRGHRR